MHENISKNLGHWKSFDDTDGLGHHCRRFLVDSDGYIWIATGSGLSRYDGKGFINLTEKDGLTHTDLHGLIVDKEDNMWIGTMDGLHKYDGKKFIRFGTEHGLVDDKIASICQHRDGSIWIGTTAGLSKYDGQRFANFTMEDGLAGNNVNCVYPDKNGNIWVGTENGLGFYDGNEFGTFPVTKLPTNTGVLCIYQDKEGILWIGTIRGLVQYDGSKFSRFSGEEYLASISIRCVYQDRDDNIWIGTGGDGVSYGVSCYDGEKIVNLGISGGTGMASTNVHDIIQDREGNFWFACDHGGISVYNPYEFIHISDEPVEEVMAKDKSGDLWWGSRDTITHFDGNNTEHHSIGYKVFSILEDTEGHFWIGTDNGGVFKFHSKKNLESPERMTGQDILAGNSALVIHEDNEGNIWIGCNHGLNRYDGHQMQTFTAKDGLTDNFVSNIFQDVSGVLWFQGWVRGITSYDGKQFRAYTRNDGLLDNCVTSMSETGEGLLWIGTRIGMDCFDGKSFIHYTTENGLSAEFVQRIIRDSKGQLWIATLGGGISRYDGADFQTLTTADGLPSNSITGVVECSDGSMAISTYKGVCKYVPDYVTPPLIRIDEVDADRVYSRPEAVQVSGDVSSIRIRYHGISFRTKKMRYKYILEGYDEDWMATWDEEVRYENLPEGEYTFRVIAINKDLVRSQEPAELKLVALADPREKVISELGRQVEEGAKRLEEMRAAKDYIDNVIKSMADTLIILTPDGIIYAVNQATLALLGYTEDELVGESLEIIIAEDKRPQKPILGDLLSWDSITNVEKIYQAKNGVRIPVLLSSSIMRDSDGKIQGIVCLAQDITELKESERKYRELVENANSIIMRMDTNGYITFFNEFAQSFFGYDEPSILGQNVVGTIIAETDSSGHDLAEMIRNIGIHPERYANNEGENIKRNGERVWISWTNKPIYGSDGSVVEILRIGNDVTELRATQRQFIQQERLRALGQLASGIAHDFNNTLTPVLGYSDLLLNVPSILDNKEKLMNHLEIIKTAAEDARSVVSRLREFYRVRDEAVVFTPVDLNQIIKEVAQLTQPMWKDQAQANNTSIDIDMHLHEIPLINGSKAELREMLTNLVINAVDAIPMSGTVFFNTRTDGRNVIIEVRDTGAGMTEEARQRCFDPFFSTKGERGTGLGLAMVYGVIQRHSGSISVRSDLGIGTTFTIKLPQIETRLAEIPLPEIQSKIHQLHVLVVDDDPQVLETITQYLMADGHTYEAAINGREGLEKLHEGNYDLVITDRAMPDMSGTQLAVLASQYASATPIIMITGFGDLMKSSGEKVKHVDCVLGKPITLSEFREALAKVID